MTKKKQYPALCSLSKVNIPVSPCECVCVCDISVCIELLLAKNYMDLYGIYKALDRYLCHSGFNMSILMVHLLVLTKRQDELNEIVDLAWLQSQHFTMTIYVSQSIVDTYTYTLTHTHRIQAWLLRTHCNQQWVSMCEEVILYQETINSLVN